MSREREEDKMIFHVKRERKIKPYSMSEKQDPIISDLRRGKSNDIRCQEKKIK
jgi:hypothetical protein